MISFILFVFIASTFAQVKNCQELRNKLATEGSQVFSIDEAFYCIDEYKISPENKTTIVNWAANILEAYAFKDILKAPPQPAQYPDYYTAFDIDAHLKYINTTNYTTFYDFFHDMQQTVVRSRDSHFSFGVSGDNNDMEYRNLTHMSYALPFNFKIVGKDFFLVPHSNTGGFSEGGEVEPNKNKTVSTINGEHPAEFIRKFADQYTALYSPHAKFSSARVACTYGVLASTPVKKDYLKQDVKVVYADNTTVTYKYGIIISDEMKLSAQAKRNLRDLLSGTPHRRYTMEDLIETEEQYQLKQQLKRAEQTHRKYAQGDNVYCYIDEVTVNNVKQYVNTFVMATFQPPDGTRDAFIKVIKDCVALFDTNQYPIQIIFPNNGGGDGEIEQMFQTAFAPYNDVRYIDAIRKSELSEVILFNQGYGQGNSHTQNCSKHEEYYVQEGQQVKPGAWYTTTRTVVYGNATHNATHNSTQMFIEAFKEENRVEFKKYVRKPTEIITYTDSQCFSCCSVSAKGFKEHGASVLVGFDGDPTKGGVDRFEVGQSPTAVINMNDQMKGNPDYKLPQLGISMGISFMPSYRFNYDYNETIPREYLIEEIDERSDINEYIDSDAENRHKFTKKTLDLVKKYETDCNPNNTRLLKVDLKGCNETIYKIDPNAVGGYKCGSNGKWTNECAIAFCKHGYLFDRTRNKCIINKCNPPPGGNGTTPGGNTGGNGTTPGGSTGGNGTTPGGNTGGNGTTPGGNTGGNGTTPGGSTNGNGTNTKPNGTNTNKDNGTIMKSIIFMIMMIVALII